jgi:hypothetical protein
VVAVALGAGAIRLLPWLLAEEVPLEVCWPFARALAAVAVETGFLVGLPLGFAVAASDFVERGEARALLALGARPVRIAAGAMSAALLLAASAFAASSAWGSDAALPGRFAAQLVAQGRASCARIREPRAVLVPLVGVTWTCFPRRAPRVVGVLPGGAKDAFFSAASLKPSEDLRSFALTDLELLARRPDGSEKPALKLRVRRALVAGLSSWGRPPHLPLRARAALVAATGSFLGLLVAWSSIAFQRASRLSAAAVGGASALAALTALQGLDRAALSPSAYALVPAAGAAAMLVAELLLRAGSRFPRLGKKGFAPASLPRR